MDARLELLPSNWILMTAVARASGFAVLVPTLGLASLRARFLLAAVLALIIATATAPSSGRLSQEHPIQVVLVELAVGVTLGFALRVMVSAVRCVACLVEQQVGLAAFDDPEDPTPLRSLYLMTTLALFLCTSGHRAIIAALLHEPQLGNLFGGERSMWPDVPVQLVTAAWCLVVHTALPLVVSLLSTQLAAGMIARVVPQFCASAVAAPVQIGVGLVLILLSIASVSTTFGHGLDWIFRLLREGSR